MRQMMTWGLVLTGALFAAGTAVAQLDSKKPAAAAAKGVYAPGTLVLVDAHNAYPSDGKFADRIDRALGTGLPMAIEQDLVWVKDAATGAGRSVVSHGGPDAKTAPTFEEYFFVKVKPIMEKALKENKRADWPLIVLNLDLKTNEPEHHAAVWALLGKYESWLTTAERTNTPEKATPLKYGPMLVLTGSSEQQQVSFHDQVPVGQRLRLFGATLAAPIPGADRKEKALNLAKMGPEAIIPNGASNYRRWVNFSWGIIESIGADGPQDWTPAEEERLRGLVARAHAVNLWIRFYTMNGDASRPAGGYNIGSPEAVAQRWKANIEAGTDYIATDQYQELGLLRTTLLK